MVAALPVSTALLAGHAFGTESLAAFYPGGRYGWTAGIALHAQAKRRNQRRIGMSPSAFVRHFHEKQKPISTIWHVQIPVAVDGVVRGKTGGVGVRAGS